MASESAEFRKLEGEPGSEAMATLNMKLLQLKMKIRSERIAYVEEKLNGNIERVRVYVSDLKVLSASRDDCSGERAHGSGNLLTLRMSYPLFKLDRLADGSAERDDSRVEEISISAPIRFPLCERIPPYTTWIFLDRNQRMTDDQSVIGRRRIYYDKHGSEALICSDSEDELGQLEMEKHEFSDGEDRILRLAFQECGFSNEVLSMLTEFVGGTLQEIQEHCHMIMEKCRLVDEQELKTSIKEISGDHAFFKKSLSDALDSFDNIFCRRCLVFDCRLHGCSQNIIYPNEKQPIMFDLEENRKPCSHQCYLQLEASKDMPKISSQPPDARKASSEDCKQGSIEVSYSSPSHSPGKQSLGGINPLDHHNELEKEVIGLDGSQEEELERDVARDGKDDSHPSGSLTRASTELSEWKPLEKDLYLKGLEIFGKNSCFIARNLLPGLKTCKEVSCYMYGDGASTSCGSSGLIRSFFEDIGKADMGRLELDFPLKSRICRKRGRIRKVKSSWKSAGHPSLWRRIADGKDLPCKQYNPCSCQPMCGKECPCLQTGTCCEKYCGCSINCKNRFRGCHCAKSQCKSRLCPCFAAGRECDPDVCRYCWVGCGGGELGEPTRRGDNQCENMKLLLRQQQRILLAKSDIAGWGAFLKRNVNKNDYLGEYTGELISHQEADKRGKIYDRANSSFLFDLNDKFVLDAYRKGDKLKFANHSSTPNCHAKVMLVAGDHRVGIYANESVEAGQEIFYDYRYGPDQAPAWARKPETSKRDGSPIPQGRAKKHHSQSG